jgi:hypothetical protein
LWDNATLGRLLPQVFVRDPFSLDTYFDVDRGWTWCPIESRVWANSLPDSRTRMRYLVALVLTFLTVTGCKTPPPATPFIVLDGGFNLGYAMKECLDVRGGQHPEVSRSCGTDVTQQVRDFEIQVASEVAANSACNGIPLVRAGRPDSMRGQSTDATRNGPYWALMLKLTPGAKKQEWSMWSSDRKSQAEGAGDAREIARRVCAVVSERGGRRLN